MGQVTGERADRLSTAARWMAAIATMAIIASVLLMIVVAALGPSAAVPEFPAAGGWPVYFSHAHPSAVEVAVLIWLSAAAGGIGLTLGLLAIRRGWRPRARRLILGSVLAVIALTVTPPVGSTDIMDYAAYGRLATLDHSPYVETPLQLRRSGDPIGATAPHPWQKQVSVYGPIATATERAASGLAGPSAARTVFWLKVWNGLAYLALVLALDRVLRSASALRARAHLLWSVNPFMLFGVMAAGHVDGLATAVGVIGLLVFRRIDARHGLAAGFLVGLSIAVKAPFALFGGGLAWASRRSLRTLATLALGAVAVLVPGYALAGKPAVTALVNTAHGAVDLYQPWQLLYRVVHWSHVSQTTDTVALIATVLLAVLLLWRLPGALPGLPAVQQALALTLAWLICSPQQRPWFDAMIFPLLAVMPATRLDWIVLVRALVATAAELPGVTYYPYLRPPWLSTTAHIISRGIAPSALTVATAALLYLCVTNRWTRGGGPEEASLEPQVAGALRTEHEQIDQRDRGRRADNGDRSGRLLHRQVDDAG